MLENIRNFEYKGAIMTSYGSMFFEGALNVILIALMGLLAQDFGRTIGETAMLVSAKSLGTFLLLYISGSLSDRYGRKPIVALGAACFSLFMLAYVFINNFYLALLFAFIGGIGHGLMDAPGMAILFDVFRENAAPAQTLVQFFFSSGGALTTAVVSWLVANNVSWRYLVFFWFVYGLLLILITLRSKFPQRASEISDDGAEPILLFSEKPHPKREGVLVFLCMGGYAIINAVVFTWLPTYMQAEKGMIEAVALNILTYYQIGGVVGAILFSQILRRVDVSRLMVINSLLSLLVFTALLFTNNTLLLFALSTLLGAFVATYFSFCINMGGLLFSEQAGAITGAIGTINMLLNAVTTWLTGFIIADISITAIFSFTVLIFIFYAIMSFLLDRRYQEIKLY